MAMTNRHSIMAGQRYRLPNGDTVLAMPAGAPRAAPLSGCIWLLFGAHGNYAIAAGGDIRMTMAARAGGAVQLAPDAGWHTGFDVADLRPLPAGAIAERRRSLLGESGTATAFIAAAATASDPPPARRAAA